MPKFNSNLTMLFNEFDFLDRFKAAKDAGFKGVEYLFPYPYRKDDIYHMQIMEGDLAPTIQRHFGSIRHMQLADNPGRHEPGTGEINYPFLFQFIDKLGYAGWIGCEYKPAKTTHEGLGWLKPYV